MKYIPLDAVIAEIKRRLWLLVPKMTFHQQRVELEKLLSFLNTLEVKEVDLDFQTFAKEMDTVFNLPSSETKNTEEEPLNWEYAIAKHFFALGMAVNNPITAADRGVAEEIIINLKRVEQDYKIDLTKEIEWVRNKAQKGE